MNTSPCRAAPLICPAPQPTDKLTEPVSERARTSNRMNEQGYTVGAVAQRAGEFGSFDQLAMPHFAGLYNFACWLSQDRTTAEDLVQETYVKALKAFASFEQGTNFRAWMYRILRNTFLTTQARLKVSASLSTDGNEEAIEPEINETPETFLLARLQAEAIQNALEKLPLKFREVILLCDLEEMGYQEIGDTLGIPMGTVMSRLSRARKAMRALLSATDEGGSR